jgi:hypothetical protein
VKGKSQQRSNQVKLQEPLQYFFIFDYAEKEKSIKLDHVSRSLGELTKESSLD